MEHMCRLNPERFPIRWACPFRPVLALTRDFVADRVGAVVMDCTSRMDEACPVPGSRLRLTAGPKPGKEAGRPEMCPLHGHYSERASHLTPDIPGSAALGRQMPGP